MATRGFSDAVQEMLTEAGFEPCFVRDLIDGDEIAILHEVDPTSPTEMVITRLHRSGVTIRTGIGDTQWIGLLPTGRKIHCSYSMGSPAWRQPREPEEDEPGEAAPFPFPIREAD